MVKRKTPIRHTVKKHKRGGRTIESFTRGKGIKPRRSKRVVQSIPSFSDWQRVKEKFGTTRDPNMAIYILPDGSMLDGSGGKSYRSLDHMVITKAFGEQESLTRTYDFCEDSGTIRVLLSSSAEDASLNVMIHTNKEPTPKQWYTIGHMKPKRGRFVYDIKFKYPHYRGKSTNLSSYGTETSGITNYLDVVKEDYEIARSIVRRRDG